MPRESRKHRYTRPMTADATSATDVLRARFNPLIRPYLVIYVALILVAFGTSLPELAVNLQAVMRNQPAIALGNAVGSNVANFGLTLGAAALVAPLTVRWRSAAVTPLSDRKWRYWSISTCTDSPVRSDCTGAAMMYGERCSSSVMRPFSP